MKIGSPSTDKMGTGVNLIHAVLQIKRSVNGPCVHMRNEPATPDEISPRAPLIVMQITYCNSMLHLTSTFKLYILKRVSYSRDSAFKLGIENVVSRLCITRLFC